jgi:hypothetical protein
VRRRLVAAVLAGLVAAAAPGSTRAQQPSGGAGAAAAIPAAFVGKWRGLAGTGEAKSVEQVRTATVTKDFGHLVDEFEFEVAGDGGITGSGKATYWFNVSSETDLIVTRITPTAYLEGKQQTLEFDIEGRMTPEGRIQLRALPRRELVLINAGSRQTMGAWNVFGPHEEQVLTDECRPAVRSERMIDPLGMRLLWSAERACGVDCAVDRDQGVAGPVRSGTISLIVIHATGGPDCNPAIAFRGGTFEGIVRYLSNNDRGVSIHYVVGRRGEVARLVPDDRLAVHLTLNPHSAISERSIGIELVNDGDGNDPFPQEQILALVDLLVELLCTHGLDSNALQGHGQLMPGQLVCNGVNTGRPRRIDPGPAFPWETVRTLVDARLAELR